MTTQNQTNQNVVRRLHLLMEHSQMFAVALSFVHADESIGDIAFENERVVMTSDLEWALEGGPPDEREEELEHQEAA